MKEVFSKWLNRYFSDEEAVLLLVLLLASFGLIATMGQVLAPVIASVVLAFLVHGLNNAMLRMNCPPALALSLSYIVFIGFFLGSLLILLPLIGQQMRLLLAELPGILSKAQQALLLLPQKYPNLIAETQLQEWIELAQSELRQVGQAFLSFSLAGLQNFLTLMLYLILIPILVFFFLKDREQIFHWLGSLLPRNRPLMYEIWDEMKAQIANYVRGKAVEIFVVGVVTYIVFALMGLKYAAFLALLVGLSVVIPYIGAAVVTIPVVLIAFFQWGWSADLFYLAFAYAVIQALDGNVLVPLLFSEAVNLHPIVIIVAVLVFGSLWGVWGVFFAIPLATFFKAVLNAWPISGQVHGKMEEQVEGQ
jgi:putative permease